MSNIIDELTPTQYKESRFAIQRDEEGNPVLTSDIFVYNAAGKKVGDDHPTPQATPAQLAAFVAWLNTNLDLYEMATGLTPLVEPT